MKISTSRRRGAAVPLRPIALACSALLLPVGAAYAQDAAAPDANLNKVVVTGIRASIESSVATKRNSDSIVEAITAEDLGKLPDQSIAESLVRLPGLAGQRVNGSTQVVSIRGMAPKYGMTLLNGREIVSTGADRSVELDQFPAELMAGAVVYKSPDATLASQGLSGTINMKTVRPLDFTGRQGNVNVRAEQNSLGAQIPGVSATGNRISASYIDQFADRTIGVALGFAHLDSPEQQQHYNNWWWANTANTKSYPADWCGGDCGLKGVARDAVALQGFEATAYSTSQKRDGLMGVLEFKPNKDLHSVVDLYFSHFDKKYVGREFQGDMTTWDGSTYTNATYGNYGGEKILTGGSIANTTFKLLSRLNKRTDDIQALGWNTEYKVGGWTTVADLSYSKTKRDESTGEMYVGPKDPPGFSSFQINTNGFSQFTPSINWADPSKVQLQQYWGQMGSTRFFKVDDEAKAIRLGARRDLDFGALNHVDAGLIYSERSKDYKATKVAYDMKSGATSAPIPAGILGAPATLGFGAIPSVANFDVQSLLNTGMFTSRADDLSSQPGRQYGVREKVTTAYGKAGLEFEALVPVTGNAGLQVIRTDQTGMGYAWDSINNVGIPISAGKSYTDILPSLNLKGDLGNNTVLRFAAARVMARPNMEDMRAGLTNISRADPTKSAGAPLFPWSADGGNPKLDPWRAKAYDLSLEKYFGKRSYVSGALFLKKLESTIYTLKVPVDFHGVPDPLAGNPAINQNDPHAYWGMVNAPANGHGGFIKGSEVAATLDGTLVSQSLDGFGVQISNSQTESNVHMFNDFSNPLDGLSGTVNSVVVYYEKNGFQVRLAQRYRSRYLAAVRNVWGDTSYTTIEPETITDFQIGYGIDSGAYKGLSVLFQINNLTNTPYRTMTTVDSNSGTVPGLFFPSTYEKYGRQYLAGITYKF